MAVTKYLAELQQKLAEEQHREWEQVGALKHKNVFVCAEVNEPNAAYALDQAISLGVIKNEDVQPLADLMGWEGDMKHLTAVLKDTDGCKDEEFHIYYENVHNRCQHFVASRIDCHLDVSSQIESKLEDLPSRIDSQLENLDLSARIESQLQNLDLSSQIESQLQSLDLPARIESQLQNLDLSSHIESQLENLDLSSKIDAHLENLKS